MHSVGDRRTSFARRNCDPSPNGSRPLLRQGYGGQALLRQGYGGQALLRQGYGGQALLRQGYGGQALLRQGFRLRCSYGGRDGGQAGGPMDWVLETNPRNTVSC